MSKELLSLAIAMTMGLMMTRLFKVLHLNFPDVTAFLVSGLLVGPYCLGRIGVPGLGFNSFADVESLEIISTVALGFIAFSIGNEFKLSQLRGTGRQAAVVGVMQAVTAMENAMKPRATVEMSSTFFTSSKEVKPRPDTPMRPRQ